MSRQYCDEDVRFNNAHDLEKFGIIPLTGESCAYSQRILCDLTEQGKQIMEAYTGMAATAENWNPGTEDNPHVASCMISRWGFDALYRFVAFHVVGSRYYVEEGNHGFSSKEYYDLYNCKKYGIFRNCRYRVHDLRAKDGRNIHQTSGRSE